MAMQYAAAKRAKQTMKPTVSLAGTCSSEGSRNVILFLKKSEVKLGSEEV